MEDTKTKQYMISYSKYIVKTTVQVFSTCQGIFKIN
jgi:hypothetical protein